MTHRGKIREFPSVLFVASVARFLSSAFFRLGFTPLGVCPLDKEPLWIFPRKIATAGRPRESPQQPAS